MNKTQGIGPIISAIVAEKQYSTYDSTLFAHDRYWDGKSWDRDGQNTYLYQTREGQFFIVFISRWPGENDSIRLCSLEEAKAKYEELPEKAVNPDPRDVSWLIQWCEFAQTQEMLEFYKSLKPDYQDVSYLIVNCKFAQTQEMLEYYKSLKPNYQNVSYLIANCKFAQIQEMLEYYKSLKPDYQDVSYLIVNCKFAQIQEMLEYYKSLTPPDQYVWWLTEFVFKSKEIKNEDEINN